MSRVSVIMPVFNKEDHITTSIRSVLNQTYKNFELIIINDGSTDSSADIIKKYTMDSRVIFYELENNKGVSHARNLGISLATSPHICFLDADDVYHPLFLEKMVRELGDANTVYCGFYNKYPTVIKKSKMNFFKGDILEEYIKNRCTPNTDCWLISKAFLERHKINFPESYSWGEDMMFFSKILFHDNNVRFVREYLTYYNRGIVNSLSQNSIEKIDQDIYWMKELKKYIMSNEKNSNRKIELFKAIDSYRIPATIIYRINKNLSKQSKVTLINILNSYRSILKNIRLTNGIRSIKLVLYYYKVSIQLNGVKSK